jgi:hypothetical protein
LNEFVKQHFKLSIEQMIDEYLQTQQCWEDMWLSIDSKFIGRLWMK